MLNISFIKIFRIPLLPLTCLFSLIVCLAESFPIKRTRKKNCIKGKLAKRFPLWNEEEPFSLFLLPVFFTAISYNACFAQIIMQNGHFYFEIFYTIITGISETLILQEREAVRYAACFISGSQASDLASRG